MTTEKKLLCSVGAASGSQGVRMVGISVIAMEWRATKYTRTQLAPFTERAEIRLSLE